MPTTSDVKITSTLDRAIWYTGLALAGWVGVLGLVYSARLLLGKK